MEGQIAEALMENATGRPTRGARPVPSACSPARSKGSPPFTTSRTFLTSCNDGGSTPPGSTMCALRLFDFMPTKTRLVTVAQYHERSREITVYATGPRAKLVDLRTLAPVIEREFSRYGYAHSPKFLPHLPTGVDLRRAAQVFLTLMPVLRDGFLAAEPLAAASRGLRTLAPRPRARSLRSRSKQPGSHRW
jgi:hypothetical protein